MESQIDVVMTVFVFLVSVFLFDAFLPETHRYGLSRMESVVVHSMLTSIIFVVYSGIFFSF